MSIEPALIYKDKAGEYRWRRHDQHNGKIIGASSEGYKNVADAVENYFTINGAGAPKPAKEG